MQPQVLTEEQAALYDRQIRLWGVEAQQSLGQSNILMYGFTAVASEICKNLVLAGIKSIQINDTLKCTTEDQGAHLFLQGSVGQNVCLFFSCLISHLSVLLLAKQRQEN
jgi:ubiquitin-like 1-activating enzyme E1 A